MTYTPGTFVHYRSFGSQEPHWPALVCTDDVALESFLRTRPGGYSYLTVVLLMGEKLEFRWARSTEMFDYDPFVPFEEEEKVGSTLGLGNAYEMVNNALEAGLDLDYWREQVRNPIVVVSNSEDVESDSDEECSDVELKRAIRASRHEYYGKGSKKASGKRPASLPTPSLSPRDRARNSSSRFSATETKSTHIGSLFRLSTAASSSSAPGPSGYFRQREDLRTSSLPKEHRLPSRGSNEPIDLTEESSATTPVDQRIANTTPFQRTSFFDRTLGSLDRSLTTATSDTVAGELSQSKDFVQVLVGRDEEASMLQMKNVWDRPYFRSQNHGVNYFDKNDEGIWQLQHPQLHGIQPADFRFIAEYFESDDFGQRHPRTGDEMEEAYDQCVAAWGAAVKLGMHDLMDHIVDKLQRIEEPDLYRTLLFACLVYGAPDTEFLACQQLKDLLATRIAEGWLVYLGDDHVSVEFLEKLKVLPELELDIYERRLPALRERIQQQEDDDTEMG